MKNVITRASCDTTLFERIFLMSMQVRNKNCGRSFYWILYNREIQYKGSNITSILSYFICQLNHVIINVSLIVLCGCFLLFCGPIVLFTIFVKSTTCHLTFGFTCICFFFLLWAHMTFVPLFYIIFLSSSANGGKNIIIYLLFEWFYVAWKQEYTFVLCLLPTWTSNMWSNHIIQKEFFFVILAG
jgi:hypothetical protein